MPIRRTGGRKTPTEPGAAVFDLGKEPASPGAGFLLGEVAPLPKVEAMRFVGLHRKSAFHRWCKHYGVHGHGRYFTEALELGLERERLRGGRGRNSRRPAASKTGGRAQPNWGREGAIPAAVESNGAPPAT